VKMKRALSLGKNKMRGNSLRAQKKLLNKRKKRVGGTLRGDSREQGKLSCLPEIPEKTRTMKKRQRRRSNTLEEPLKERGRGLRNLRSSSAKNRSRVERHEALLIEIEKSQPAEKENLEEGKD